MSLSALGGLTLLMLLLQAVIHPATAALIYILAVLLSAMRFGLYAGLSGALLAALAFSYFFVPPYGGFAVTSLESAVRLGVFLCVTLLVSGLASRARRQTMIAQQRAAELHALYELSQLLSAEVTLERILPIVTRKTAQLLAVPHCWVILGDAPNLSDADEYEQLPLHIEQRRLGVLRVMRRRVGQPLGAEARAQLEIIAAQVSLVLERVRLAELAGQAHVLAESDRLKSTLLSLVSHDLRTPLAAIKGSASGLLDPTVAWSDAQRHALLTTIDQESDRLSRLVGELLEMSRIEAGAIAQVRSWHRLDELITVLAARLQAQYPAMRLECSFPADLPWVNISYAQIEHVLRNLLENALSYAPVGSLIELCVSYDPCAITVALCDRGPGVAADLHERIFEKFVRAAAAERHAGGAGLGLAICKGLVEAHGGRIWVEDRPGGGAVFRFTLPQKVEGGGMKAEAWAKK